MIWYDIIGFWLVDISLEYFIIFYGPHQVHMDVPDYVHGNNGDVSVVFIRLSTIKKW